jgi:hypothetical protein
MGWYDVDEDIHGNMKYSEEDLNEHAVIEGSALFKELMETAMIENYIDDEMIKKRIWLLRKLHMTITHEDINFYMNKATDERINELVAERTMELANE